MRKKIIDEIYNKNFDWLKTVDDIEFNNQDEDGDTLLHEIADDYLEEDMKGILIFGVISRMTSETINMKNNIG